MRNVFMMCVVLLGFGILPLASDAATSVNISLFHNDLAPYGTWTTVAPYGSVWVPAHVAPGWRPYTRGYWTYTDYGWTWVSYEPFGRDVYHYGRWVYDSYEGWVWVPDTVWAPAWVAWQEGDDYVGWAPLPPASRWASSGLVYSSSAIATPSWVFVQRPYFLNRHINTYVVPVARNVTVLRTTKDVTHFDVAKGKPVNRGIDVTRVESTNGKKMVKTYTSQRQNVRTQRRASVAQTTHLERRTKVAPSQATRVERRTKRNESPVANRQRNISPQKAQKNAAPKGGKGKGKGKP